VGTTIRGNSRKNHEGKGKFKDAHRETRAKIARNDGRYEKTTTKPKAPP
jgi:hypothetical protein